MHTSSHIYIYDFVWAISEAIDLISPVLHDHHKKVAYISGRIAQEIGMSNDEIHNIILAAMLHDIGACSMEDWGKLLTFELDEENFDHHAFWGYAVLKDFGPLSKASELIRHHHAFYYASGNEIPIGSYVIHLADRVSLLIDEHSEILHQVPQTLEILRRRQDIFHPDVLAAFVRLAKRECFWIEASSSALIRANMLKRVHLSKEIVNVETIRAFAKVGAQIIDFRSRFTSTHSSGVAAVAMLLTQLSGFSEGEYRMMEIAGFLHDLGKLAVSNEILEKDGPLNEMEFCVIRKHTYYTYAILTGLRGLEHIASWAAYHHERLDGTGYPFHVNGPDLSKQSRIMAVADVITALTEDRPYRSGMNRKKAEEVLADMVSNNTLDRDIVCLANENFTFINEVRMNAQKEAHGDYMAFRAHVHECVRMRDKIA